MTYLLEMQANVARRDATGVLVEAEGVGLRASRHLWGNELDEGLVNQKWPNKQIFPFPKHTVDVWINIRMYGAETRKEW